MKKLLSIATLLVLTVWANAQTVYLCKDGDYTTANIAQGMEIDLTAGYDSVTFAKPQMAPVVKITYNGTSASVAVPSFLSGVTASVSGANVTITSENTTDEVTYATSGQSADGSLTIIGSYKLTLALNGLDLTSATGAAIDIQCGKRTEIVLGEGTVNSLADAATGTQKGCLRCKGHLEVSGNGTLNVTGNKNHAISTNEYFQIKRTAGTVNILKAANDGIHAGQYFQMNGGTLNINGTTVGDCVQAELTTDPEDEHNGEAIIKGGTLNITVAAEDSKGIKADTDITISGGTFNILAAGNGSRGIQNDGNVVIGEEDNTTSITITAAGGKCTNPECAADPHNCMGMKTEGNLTVNAGYVKVSKTGNKAKAIKVAGTYTLNGGTVDAEVVH